MNLDQGTWITGLLACGMGVALLGSVKTTLARRLAMDEARVGGLLSMFGFALIPVMLVMGFLTDLLNKQWVVVAGSLLMASSLILLSRARKYGTTLLAVLLLSAGWGGVINVLNVLMQKAFGGSPTYAMNLGNFFFGLGAFLTPLIAAFLLKRAGFITALSALAVLSLMPGLLALGVDFNAMIGAAARQAGGPGIETLLRDPIMWLTALGMVFYAPMEATMAAWATTYLGDKGVPEAASSATLSGFWMAYTLARLATAVWVSAFPLGAAGTNSLIVGLSACCALVWVGTVFGRGRGMACLMVVLAGLVFGPTFPTLIGVLTGHADPAVAGRAVGLFFAIGGIGWSVIPLLIGAYARRAGVQRAFLIAVGCAVGLTLTAVALRPFMQ